ncbi:MAG: hypothetical protein IPN10_18130 [Saprospiraceae bacterium]|nr:hypothetical protein [Saprospiraceae bacterium]
MNSNHNFNGAIGAWIDSELHPTGATSPASSNSNFMSMKLNNVYAGLDYLCIAWFGVDMSNPKQPTINTGNTGLSMIVSDAKSQNPGIKLFATLAFSTQILNELRIIINNPTLLQAFATNIASFLSNNNMDGFDIDWEDPISELKPTECALWLNALRTAFGNNRYISISPATYVGLDANAVNSNCDVINLQNYSGFTFPEQFVQHGINPALLGFGAKFETTGNGDPNPYQNAFEAYNEYTAGFTTNGIHYAYNTICNWRLDSDDWAFEQGQQLLLRQYITMSPDNVPFDDGLIVSAQTTPTLMQSVTVWSGEVVDAIQTSNQNQNGSFIVELLQHGGETGNQNPSIILPAGLTQFSYVKGFWYGNFVIAQITVAGQSFPSSVNPSVSGTKIINVQVPAGKTIIAFKGSSLYVQLAGGGFTWVLDAIDGVFG